MSGSAPAAALGQAKEGEGEQRRRPWLLLQGRAPLQAPPQTEGRRSLLASLTLHPWEEITLRSAGIRSPPRTSTRSPTTTFSALIWIFSPSRMTRACCGMRETILGGGTAALPTRCPPLAGIEVASARGNAEGLGVPGPPALALGRTFFPNGGRAAHLRHHVFEGVHNFGALGLLVVGEAAGDDDHGCQHHTQVQLGRNVWKERRSG